MCSQNLYESIIQNAQLQNRKKLRKSNINYKYYEKHHIIPKCLGGTNDDNNLVLLTAKEHYICHKLLIDIYPNNRKLVIALMRMSGNKKYNVSAKEYACARENFSRTPMSEETKEKLRKAITGVKHPQWRNELKSKYQLGIKHKKYSEQGKKNCSLGQKKLYENGYVSPRKGKKMPKEVIDKLSELNSKPIFQYDKKGNFIKKWPSRTEAANSGFVGSNICACVNGKRKTCGGYIWKNS